LSDEPINSPELSPQDQRLLDALIECGFDAGALQLPAPQRRRAESLARLLGLLNDYPVEDADPALVDATLARIDHHERQRDGRMRVEPAPRRRLFLSWRMPDLVTIAAVLLIGVSVLFPIMHQMRTESIANGCANNLRMMSLAFANYAADSNGALPASAGLTSTWSRTARNLRHLAPLIDGGYCEAGHLRCPGHTGPGDSYSYQWQTPEARLRWQTGRVGIAMGDCNPLIDAIRHGAAIDPSALSSNHRGRGQNVLGTDGSHRWLEHPFITPGDNIWLPEGGPGGLEEGVVGEGDVFLAH
jgi:hypothetical protein